jgi:hypothetical protein
MNNTKQLKKALLFFIKQSNIPKGFTYNISIVSKYKNPGDMARHGNCFRITLRTDNYNDMLYCLAHEFAHCFQFASGLVEENNKNVVWKGVTIPKLFIGSNDWDKRPWEIDAEERAKNYIKQYKNRGIIRKLLDLF